MERPNRRNVLRGAPAVLGALAGCNALRDLVDADETTTHSTTASPDTTTTEPAATTSDYPHRIHVSNETPDVVYLTVAVARDADPVFSVTRRIEAGVAVTFDDVVQRTGAYEVSVETTDGRSATREWPVSPAMSDLSVTIRRGEITFSQEAYCDPTCPPLSMGGSVAKLPYYGTDADNPLYYGATLSIENASGDTRDVHVLVSRGETPVLNHRYRVPAGTTLAFPGIHVAGRYDVRVSTNVATGTHVWRITKERYLTATITGDAVDIGCGVSTAAFALENDDSVAHEVIVRARPSEGIDAADDLLFTETYVLPAGSSELEAGVFTGTGHHLLDVSLVDGDSTTYDWWLCPPRGPTEIRISEAGELSVIQIIPAE